MRLHYPCYFCKTEPCTTFLYKETGERVKTAEKLLEEINGIQPNEVRVFNPKTKRDCPHFKDKGTTPGADTPMPPKVSP